MTRNRRQLVSQLEVIAISLGLTLQAVSEVASAEPVKPDCRIGVITTPIGDGIESKIVRSLIPSKESTHCKLIPYEALALQIDIQLEKRIEKMEMDAKNAALSFDLLLAAQLWRQAADTLLKIEEHVLHFTLVANFLTNAGAASVDAGDYDVALLYFRRSLALNSNPTSSMSISPKAQEIYDSARESGPVLLATPRQDILKNIAERMGVDGVLWVSMGADGDEWIISRKLVALNKTDSGPEIVHRLAKKDAIPKELIEREHEKTHALITEVFPPPVETVEKRPWYKNWWIYAAGAVVVGTAVGIGIATSSDPDKVNVVVYN